MYWAVSGMLQLRGSHKDEFVQSPYRSGTQPASVCFAVFDHSCVLVSEAQRCVQLIHCHLLLPLHRIATVTLQRFQWFYDSCSSQSLMSLAATGTRNLPWASIQLYLWCYAIEGDAFEAYPSVCLHDCAKHLMECPGHSMVPSNT